MYKSLVSVGACIASILMSSTVYATTNTLQDNWYAGLCGDVTWLSHTDTGGGNIDVG